MDNISVVILSGGKSSRMGRDKAKLILDGQSFVERICGEFSDCEEILFSVKEEADFPEVKLLHITDFYPGCGPMAGIHSALHHSKNPWVFVIACDMPFIKKSVLKELIDIRDQFMTNTNMTDLQNYAIIPVSEDGRLQVLCALYHKHTFKVFDQMLTEKQYRMRDCLRQLEVTYVPVDHFTDHEKVFRNINTLEDYEEISK